MIASADASRTVAEHQLQKEHALHRAGEQECVRLALGVRCRQSAKLRKLHTNALESVRGPTESSSRFMKSSLTHGSALSEVQRAMEQSGTKRIGTARNAMWRVATQHGPPTFTSTVKHDQ